jgi:hypothetical protein
MRGGQLPSAHRLTGYQRSLLAFATQRRLVLGEFVTEKRKLTYISQDVHQIPNP